MRLGEIVRIYEVEPSSVPVPMEPSIIPAQEEPADAPDQPEHEPVPLVAVPDEEVGVPDNCLSRMATRHSV